MYTTGTDGTIDCISHRGLLKQSRAIAFLYNGDFYWVTRELQFAKEGPTLRVLAFEDFALVWTFNKFYRDVYCFGMKQSMKQMLRDGKVIFMVDAKMELFISDSYKYILWINEIMKENLKPYLLTCEISTRLTVYFLWVFF